MKIILLPVILIAFLISCNNSHREKTDQFNSKNDTATNEFDSIKGGNGFIYFPKSIDPVLTLKEECIRSNPLNHENVKSALGELLSGDTLILAAIFCQCGEFGGDKEKIVIFRSDTNFDCILVRDSVRCRDENGNHKFYRTMNNHYTLSKTQTNIIADYIELLTRYSLMEKVNHNLVSSYFSATIIRNANYRKDFSIDLYDTDGSWPYFDILKNEIMKNACKKVIPQ